MRGVTQIFVSIRKSIHKKFSKSELLLVLFYDVVDVYEYVNMASRDQKTPNQQATHSSNNSKHVYAMKEFNPI